MFAQLSLYHVYINHIQPRLPNDNTKYELNNIPTRTGKPGGNFIDTNSLSLSKCLKGAMTSRTFSKLKKTKNTIK